MRQLAVALLVAASASGVAAPDEESSWNDPVQQWADAVRFSHRFHIEDVEAECTDCHAEAEESRSSSDFLLPGHADCSSCHEVEEESECELCHTAGAPRVAFAEPARRVLFDHRLHLEQGGLECGTCHVGVETSDLPSHAHLPRMALCSTCHNDAQAPQACESCHVTVQSLRPLSHRRDDWLDDHERLERLGGPSNDCAACHTESTCQVCHARPALQRTGGSVVSGLRPAPSGENLRALENVHDVNYLFTHGLDARSQARDCTVCHDRQRFCVQCHESSQEAGFGVPVPLAHTAPDFLRLGVGSGGGEHARLARRDIESCAACHDVEGRDPVCLTCHVDRVPGRGNDPRTHSRRFIDDEGDWHEDPGSLCFNCHTDTRTAGVGFCGYCHGVLD